MTIYNKNGAELTEAYGTHGSNIDYAYDKHGNAIFQPTSPTPGPQPVPVKKFPLSKVVSYYQAAALEMANTINGLSSQWQSFVFIPDAHGTGDRNHSQAIAMYLIDNSSVERIVLGGDYCHNGWVRSEYEKYRQPYIDNDYALYVCPVIGNHEAFGGKITEAKSCLYADFLKNKTGISGQPKNVYYYIDNTAKKTRFIFLNTSDDGNYSISQKQQEWLVSAVRLPDSSWHFVVCGHVNAGATSFTTLNMANASRVINTIAGSNGNFVGYFCGHQHIDHCGTFNGFRQTMLLNDKLENTDYYPGYSVTNRSAGQVTEQAVSVVSFNTSTRTVKVRRIGAGWASRIATLQYTY